MKTKQTYLSLWCDTPHHVAGRNGANAAETVAVHVHAVLTTGKRCSVIISEHAWNCCCQVTRHCQCHASRDQSTRTESTNVLYSVQYPTPRAFSLIHSSTFTASHIITASPTHSLVLHCFNLSCRCTRAKDQGQDKSFNALTCIIPPLLTPRHHYPAHHKAWP